MKIAALQFDVRRGQVEDNLARVEDGLREAAALDVRLVGLPEMWPTSFVPSGSAEEAEPWVRASAEALARVEAWSAELGLVVCGSALATRAGQRPWNRLHVIDGGRTVGHYDKVHLFSPTGEREGFSAGDASPTAIATSAGSVAGAICYDLRFAPLFTTALLADAEMLVLPAQWPTPRASHWRSLLIARAVELQGFVLGVNRCGVSHVGRRELELVFPGNSMVLGPGGEVLAEGSGDEGLVVAEIDLADAARMRRTVPVRRDWRRDLLA